MGLFLSEKEVYVLIGEQLGEVDDAKKYFDQYFTPYGGGFIPRIEPDTLRFFTEEEALDLIEKQVGFPNPNIQYLGEYFFRENERCIPRVNFSHLHKTIIEKKLVEALGRVIELSLTDQRRQAVMMEIMNAIESHQIPSVEDDSKNQSVEKEA